MLQIVSAQNGKGELIVSFSLFRLIISIGLATDNDSKNRTNKRRGAEHKQKPKLELNLALCVPKNQQIISKFLVRKIFHSNKLGLRGQGTPQGQYPPPSSQLSPSPAKIPVPPRRGPRPRTFFYFLSLSSTILQILTVLKKYEILCKNPYSKVKFPTF